MLGDVPSEGQYELPHLAVGATASLRGLIALVVPGDPVANRFDID
jgi:hypothetical protein